MMKSVALDAAPQEDDYVVVDAGESELFSDEASYDYCEDAFSLQSAPQSFAIDSIALKTFQDDFFEQPSFFDGYADETVDEIQILLQGISSFDELDSDKPDAAPPELSSVSDKSVGNDGEDDESTEGSELDELSTSPSAVDVDDDEEEEEAPAEDSAESTAPRDDESRNDSDLEKSQETLKRSDSLENKLLAMAEEVDDLMNGTKMGRLTNKKRRKQRKLAKKAAAAAAAAAALSQLSLTATTISKTPTPPRIEKVVRRKLRKVQATKKQVANIAVACATESIAAFREECLLNSKKVM